MLKSSLCDHSDAGIFVKGDITLVGAGADDTARVAGRNNNFWRTLGMSLINCEFNLILTWSTSCVISLGNRQITFVITDTNCMFLL